MKIILREDVKNIGKSGDTKEVKRGYAVNYLLPHKLAYPATGSYLKMFENEKKVSEKHLEKEKKEAEELKAKFENLSLNISVKTGEDEKMFGSVTAGDIADKLKETGIEISKKQIALEDNIKKLGIYHVPIKIAPEVETELKVWIIKE
ncbi:MAG: 50S ribosomal protein L9 [Spirochaetes bacterium]|nr:50S ribosomal protein L9 [Spirochaetota bacterium]